MVIIETHAFKMKTGMMHFATGPTHENAGGILTENPGCGFQS